MAYNSSRLKTITTGYAEYTIIPSETLAVLLGAGWFSGVTAGTIIKITDGALVVAPQQQDGFSFIVNGAGTLVPLGGTLTVSATATADGLTTGTLTDLGYDFTVLVTTADANHIIILNTLTLIHL